MYGSFETIENRPALSFERRLSHPIDVVWRAITETDYTLRYYYGSAIETDWKPGSPYRMTIDGELQIEGRAELLWPGNFDVLTSGRPYQVPL